MSAAEHQSHNKSPQPSRESSLKDAPQRPSLLQPPARPAPVPPQPAPVAAAPIEPVAPAVERAVEAAPPEVASPPSGRSGLHPISAPSEPMQYRAIGLIRGVYQPSEEQLNRGMILADDGAVIEAVLLGRITSLLKKHLDLSASHLWVVYPRTRQPQEEESSEEMVTSGLHAQIVGVWEPETLGMPGENPHTETEDEDAEEVAPEVRVSGSHTVEPVEPDAADRATVSIPELPSDNYFSIRGEVLAYDDEAEQIVVKIVQGAKQPGKPPKAFRLTVLGHISGKTVGYFWELDVERQGEQLVLIEGRTIAIVPPKKKKKGKPMGGRGGRRPEGSNRPKPAPAANKEKPRIRPPAPVKSNPL